MDKTARIWEVASGKSSFELTGHGNSVLTAVLTRWQVRDGQ